LSNKVEGVIAFYGERPFAFSKIDVSIAQAIIQHLNINLSEKEWINNIAAIKRKIDNEMPLIEAGILAMEKIHDAKNKLNFAQDKLNDITAWYYDRKESKVYKNSSDAGSFIADAQEILVELVKRSKLNKSNLKTISLNNFINEIIETHLPECIPYKIEVIFKKYSDDIFVTIDKSLFKRVFHNLFDNSIHFLKDSRSQRTIKISSDKANSNALIIFSDSGPGIAPSNLDEVFDMFYTSKGEKGMGFGLAIVKRIIEDHDGSIEVKSKWGFNTEFTIKLPIK